MGLPIRTRLALVSGGLVALLLLGMGTFLYVRLEVDLLDAADETLLARAASINDDLASGSIEITELPGAGDENFAQLLSSDGHLLATSGSVTDRLVPSEVVAGSAGPRFVDTEVLTTESERIPARLLVMPAVDDRVLVLGVSLEDQRDALGRLLALMAIGGPVAVALASGVGWLVARGALRPVERMRIEAEAVSASEPGRRLPVPATRDELARLGKSLNSMLARLEGAAQRERRFLDDAAHELRTPLANLKAELELALRRDRTPEALEESVASAREETERLVRLAEDLLVLSRATGGRLPVRREDVDVAELLMQTADAFSARASEGGVSLDVSAPNGVRARLDGARVRQAIGNLLENALRHTPRGGRVTIKLEHDDGEVAIEVADTGDGFDPAFLPRAFEPFSRADIGRSRPAGGTGLGLTIVRTVVEAHGGGAEARNLPSGGAVVRLVFAEGDLIPDSRSSHGSERMVASTRREEEDG
ncbi:MAG: sensor histidine kinase [Actinomycetota bacterium]